MSKIYLYTNEKSHHEIDNFCGKKTKKSLKFSNDKLEYLQKLT